MNIKFWNDKRVLITGHTGFKGSWISLWLQSMGSNTVGYALPSPTEPSLFETANVARGMESIDGDVRDLDHLQYVIDKFKPEIVIHMAAQSLVRNSYIDPIGTYSTNIMGTVNVLEAVRKSRSVRVVLNVTSDKCYENRGWLWGYREMDPMGGHDPYSSSKGCSELITSAYYRSFFSVESFGTDGVAVASARAGNVVGGGDWAHDRLLPDIIKAFMDNKPVVIRNPDAIRPWQYVLEPLYGYLLLAQKVWHERRKFCGGWNFGDNDEASKPVSFIADYLVNLWGEGSFWEKDQSTKQPHEESYLKLDCSKAKQLLGWSPKLDLTSTLRWTVNWYKAFIQNQNMYHYTMSEIARYENYLM